MRITLWALCLGFVGVSGFGGIVDDDIIARGDANHSGVVNVSDASFISNFLFHSGPAPPCMNEADANHDGQVAPSDSTFILNWLFSGGPAPPAPGPFNTTCKNSSAPIIGCGIGC